MGDQLQAGYQEKSWKSDPVEDTGYNHERQNKTGKGRGMFLRRYNILISKVESSGSSLLQADLGHQPYCE